MNFTQKLIVATKKLDIDVNHFHKKSEIKDIAIVGHPGWCGGACTELDHQIICWQAMGIKVHICHAEDLTEGYLSLGMESRGCIYHESRDWKSLKDMHVISFCSRGFLDNVEEIRKYARTTTFANCMTWTFPQEEEACKKGLIDFFLYQSDHQLEKVHDKLKGINSNYNPVRFKPYFFAKEFKYEEERDHDFFQFGRLSREDPSKFNKKQFWIYDQIKAPLPKKGIILGWRDTIGDKFPEGVPSYIRTLPMGGMSQGNFYNFADFLIVASDTFENLPRIGFEAMASGSILIVDNRGGWKTLIEDGKTGCLCDTPDDFVQKATELAYDEKKRKDIRRAARAKLDKEWGIEASMESWDNVFKQIEKM